MAALGPFCNNLRRRVGTIGPLKRPISAEGLQPTGSKLDIPVSPKAEISGASSRKGKQSGHGVTVDEFGNSIISVAPTVFFAERVSKSFPGIRNLQWFHGPSEALDRLEILLRDPIHFEMAQGYGVTNDPIWWFRGGPALYIPSFTRLSETRCLMDVAELEIDRLAIFHSLSYWQSYVYLEVRPDHPIGVYPIDSLAIDQMIDYRGYAYEEYGIFQKTAITRACYDDGAAVIDGIVTDTSGAHLRVHYLSRYNFFITSKYSPINSKTFDVASKPLLNDILRGKDRFSELHAMIEALPRHDNDN